MTAKIGILLTNIGSPDRPTTKSVRQYLRKFLSDPRVVKIPRIFWWPILYGIILPFRAKSSAKLYQKIWTKEGSPLTTISESIARKLENELKLPVVIGMHYGKPTIKTALEKLRAQDVTKILVLPMYPQYSDTTTSSTMDQVAKTLKKWRNAPEIRHIRDYATDENYITALCDSIQKYPIKHLLFSFHGIPKYYETHGDPYAEQCRTTTRLVADKLQLSTDQWSQAFQSRLGRAEWLMPYTDKILQELPQRGIKDVHVICPGFAVDCLETLEEIAIRGKEQFLHAGGTSFHYIPALNDSNEHIQLLKNMIKNHIHGW